MFRCEFGQILQSGSGTLKPFGIDAFDLRRQLSRKLPNKQALEYKKREDRKFLKGCTFKENNHIELRYILPKETDLHALGLTSQDPLNLICFRNYLIFLINEGRIEKGTINNRNGSIRFFLVVILGKNINNMLIARLRGVTRLPTVWSKETAERFFSVIENPRDLAIFVNVYGSGLRVSEICKLKIEGKRFTK